jgi:uncharacterized protein YqeY
MMLDRLKADMKAAMKSGDSFCVGVIRMLITALNNKAIENRGAGNGELTADDQLAVLAKEAKKRQDAADVFAQGGRQDLAENEKKEAAFIARYLPAQMSAEEVEAAVKEVIAKNAGADFGAVMRAAMAGLKGKADGKAVGEAIRKLLR